MAHATGELQLTAYDRNKFSTIEEIPGFLEKRSELGHIEEALKNNLDNHALCRQIVDTENPAKVARDGKGGLIAAFGWKVVKFLGKGKDGLTFYGYRYGHEKESTHIVKVLTNYGEQYHNHTAIFNAQLRRMHHAKIQYTPMIFDQVIKKQFTHYACKKPFQIHKPIGEDLYNTLVEICYMNAWCIRNTGFVFWDLGMGNGRNFMTDTKDGDNLKWIDYGGAGMVRCPNFRSLYKEHIQDLPELTLESSTQEGLKGKENLVEGNSDFVLMQFLLNYEHHAKPEGTADVYASMLQVRKALVPEMKAWIPGYLVEDFTHNIFDKFKNSNWLIDSTWTRLGEHIKNEYT